MVARRVVVARSVASERKQPGDNEDRQESRRGASFMSFIEKRRGPTFDFLT